MNSLERYDRVATLQREEQEYAAAKGTPYKASAWNWDLILDGFRTLFLAVLLAMFFVFLYGASSTTATMKDMHDSTQFMKEQMQQMPKQAADWLATMTDSYPEHYERVVLSEVLNTISNANQISARATVLLNSLEPEFVVALLSQVDSITSQVSEIVSNTDKELASDLVTRVTSVLGTVDDILATVPSQDVQAAIRNFNNLAGHAATFIASMEQADLVSKITELADNTNAIEEKVRELHELRVSLP